MLTAKTKKRLTNALTRKKLADELESALVIPAPLSAALKRAIEVALASKKAALDLISKLELGPGDLQQDTKRRLVQEMAEKKAGQEIIDQAQS